MAIHRHLGNIQNDVNLYSSLEFQRCNKLLDGLMKEKKRQGDEPSVRHQPSINDPDWQKLDEFFDDILETRDPRKLTYYV